MREFVRLLKEQSYLRQSLSAGAGIVRVGAAKLIGVCSRRGARRQRHGRARRGAGESASVAAKGAISGRRAIAYNKLIKLAASIPEPVFVTAKQQQHPVKIERSSRRKHQVTHADGPPRTPELVVAEPVAAESLPDRPPRRETRPRLGQRKPAQQSATGARAGDDGATRRPNLTFQKPGHAQGPVRLHFGAAGDAQQDAAVPALLHQGANQRDRTEALAAQARPHHARQRVLQPGESLL